MMGSRRLSSLNRQLQPAAAAAADNDEIPPYPYIPTDDKCNALYALKFEKELTLEEIAFQKRIREILTGFNNSNLLESFENAQYSANIVDISKALGKAGLSIKEYGCSGLTHTQSAILTWELFRFDASIGTFFLVHSGLAMASIAVAGSEKQKALWLPQMATYAKTGSFALTEPEMGSDATSLKTSAKKVNGGWILNGDKRWIGNAGSADINVVWARNVDTNAIIGFLVEKGTPGFSTSKIEHKVSLRGVENANIKLTDCFVPDENLMPVEGFAGSTARVLESSRALVAAGCAGLLLGAYERSIGYCYKRMAFKRPIAAFQLVQERLMRVLGTLQGVLLTSLHIARLLDSGQATMQQIALAKGWCSRSTREGVALCREVMGGNGIVADFGVGIPFVDAEALYTYEGSYDINMLLAGRLTTGLNAIGR